MDLEIGGINQGGVLLDVSPTEMSPQFFSYAENCVFTQEGVRPLPDFSSLNVSFPVGFSPDAAIDITVNGGIKGLVFFGNTGIYLLLQDVFHNITPTNFVEAVSWTVLEFNGYVVACNGNSYPWYIDFFDYFKPMAVLPNWPLTFIPKLMAELNGFLVFFGNNSNGIFNDQLVMWSDIADIGALPSNYAIDDPASRAGITNLSGYEFFVSVKQLNKTLVVYRSKSVYLMRFVGGNAVFSFDLLFSERSLLGQNCVGVKGRLHYCVDQGGFYVHDGISATEFDSKPVSGYFYKHVNKNALDKVQVIYDKKNDYLNVLFPTTGLLCDTNLFYNFATETWSVEKLSGVRFAGSWYYPKENLNKTYEQQTETFEALQGNFTLDYPNASNPFMLYVGTDIVSAENSTTFKPSLLERKLVAYTTQDQSGGVTVKRNLQLLITECWPKLTEGNLLFRLGFSEKPFGEVLWEPFQEMDVAKINTFSSGRYLHVEFKSVNSSNYLFNGYMLKAQSLGDR
jgi:hypothetical protein